MSQFCALAAMVMSSPAFPRDSLGVFGQWGAFRDPGVHRCYAIARAEAVRPPPGARRAAQSAERTGFASVGTWPRQQVRGQVSFRLSRTVAPPGKVRLAIGAQRFDLTSAGADAWAVDQRMDAAVVAAMRSAETMSVSAIDQAGRRFTDRYGLKGAATAMDAATVACARSGR